jgi:hypothetical protein
MTPIEAKIQAAIEAAQAICDDLGGKSGTDGATWDRVETLSTETGHAQVAPIQITRATDQDANRDPLADRIDDD